MAVYQFVCHDRVRDCDMWRYRSPVSLWVEWLTAWLEHMLSQHVEAVEAALDAVDGIEEVQGNPPDHVDLTYYRSQAHYDEFGRDEAVYSVVNARSREIGAILQAEGYTVRYVYPEDADTVSTLGGRDVQA